MLTSVLVVFKTRLRKNQHAHIGRNISESYRFSLKTLVAGNLAFASTKLKTA